MATIACPHCATALSSDPSLAGQIVACPSCSRQFPIPPAVNSPPPPLVRSTSRSRPSLAHAQPTDWRQTIRFAMLVVTGLWLVSMAVLLILSLAAHFGQADIRTAGDYVIVNGRGHYRDEWILGGIIAAVTLGICFPTVPYAIAMIVLGVAHFAAKRD